MQLVVISRQPPAVQAGRELSQVLEIDPASSRWWEKVKLPPLAAILRADLSGPLGNGMRETIHHSLGDVSQLKPSAASPDVSWEAYTLSVSPPGKPYVLEVEYPSDVPQTLGLSIVETNAAGHAGADRLGLGHRRVATRPRPPPRRTGSGIGWSSGRGPVRRCC